MRATRVLKDLVGRREAVTVPGAANAMFARVIEDLGFEAVYVTGAGVANMAHGVPDIGLTTVTELAAAASSIADAVSLPIIVDADTGFGNAVNMVRTVRLLERAGAAGIQIEDQVFPKKCGHFNGKEVISADEMIQKIKAAVDARADGDLQIIARTDARAIEGLNRAIERAQAFVEAGRTSLSSRRRSRTSNSPGLRRRSPSRRSPTSCSAARRRIPAASGSLRWASPSCSTPMRPCRRPSKRRTTCSAR